MKFLIENWYLLVAAVAVLAVAGYCLYVFLRRPTNEQLKSVTEWLLWAVTEAEKELGSGTGQLKLRYVYNMFIERFSALARIISFEMFSGLVDEALVSMKNLLSTNTAVQEYVQGTTASATKESEGS
ncbi:MAG: hypothetical protein LUE24_14660 [Lachnospiraceae bacterium]|nr:hypothetical protein [Lachnospiraceae bacterium]